MAIASYLMAMAPSAAIYSAFADGRIVREALNASKKMLGMINESGGRLVARLLRHNSQLYPKAPCILWQNSKNEQTHSTVALQGFNALELAACAWRRGADQFGCWPLQGG